MIESERSLPKWVFFAPPKSVATTASLAVPNNYLPETELQAGVLIKAPGPTDDSPNTKTVFLGSATVTADQNANTGGFPLAPGESVTIPIQALGNVYCIATDANQKLNAIVL